MQLREIGEFGLIRRLMDGQAAEPGVVVPPGDDAAVLEMTTGLRAVLTCDCMVEDVHFLASASGRDIGYKLLVSNISDIAAMGGLPRFAVVTLVAPASTSVSWLDDIYVGLRECALEYGVAIVGGDTSRGEKAMFSVALLGEVEPGKELLRSTAQVGDIVCVTGPLGGSAAGLQVVLGRVAPNFSGAKESLYCHYRPKAQVLSGRIIAEHGGRVANDISDGLASEAYEIAEASSVALLLDAEKIPQTSGTVSIASALNQDPLDFALYGGEDYELLFCLPENLCPKVLKAIPTARAIGVVQAGQGVQMKRDGQVLTLARGYTHFR